MSSPETITTCLETSIKLAKSGYKKDTVFVWGKYVEPDCPKYNRDEPILCFRDDMPYEEYGHYEIVYPAYTSSEIELPEVLDGAVITDLIMTWEEGDVFIRYETMDMILYSQFAKTEVEAKAKMWLYLKENGLI